jgi:hypothetical protein
VANEKPLIDADGHGLKESGSPQENIRVDPRSSVVHADEDFIEFEESWTSAYIFEHEW